MTGKSGDSDTIRKSIHDGSEHLSLTHDDRQADHVLQPPPPAPAVISQRRAVVAVEPARALGGPAVGLALPSATDVRHAQHGAVAAVRLVGEGGEEVDLWKRSFKNVGVHSRLINFTFGEIHLSN